MQCLSTIHYCYVTQMSFPFFLCQYRVNLGSVGVKDARRSRSPCISSPIPAGHRESRPRRKGNSEACNRKGKSCWWLSKEEGAAPAPVSGETLPLRGEAGLGNGESLTGEPFSGRRRRPQAWQSFTALWWSSTYRLCMNAGFHWMPGPVPDAAACKRCFFCICS